MLTVLVFILILGLLIFVHEIGHFWAARRSGIKVFEFGFGFPPRILGLQRLKETETDDSVKEEKGVKSDKLLDSQEKEALEKKDADKTGEKSEAEKNKKWKLIWGRDKIEEKDFEKYGTVYSLNWIPLGGFVKIKGEDSLEASKDSDSFSAQSAWSRIKVLSAGVIMNIVLGWMLLTIVFLAGAPEAIDDGNEKFKDSKIQVSGVAKNSPAEVMGFREGDEIVKCIDEKDERCKMPFSKISQLQAYISDRKGQEIILEVKRGGQVASLKGMPRLDHPPEEGALGIALVKTAIVRYPWYEAIIRSMEAVFNILFLIVKTLFDILKGILVSEKVMIDVSGPVGIAFMTKQVAYLGLIYILQFAAVLSLNLAIINGLPFPALDGGRILFVILEKIKGSPVSRRVENFAHALGFFLLIVLMIVVTVRDLLRFELVEKVINFF